MPEASQITNYAKLLKLLPVGDFAPHPAAPPPPETGRKRTRKARRQGIASFIALVVLPTALVTGYMMGFAAARYESEARFVLRMPGKSTPTLQMNSLLQNAGIARSNDDGYIVRDYLESRAALANLETKVDLREIFSVPKWDVLWRFPGPFASNTEEGLYKYYRSVSSAQFDSTTGVSIFTVQAFKPEDAQRLGTLLLDSAEALVNRLNERARNDAIALTQGEVDRLRKHALDAQTAITNFREQERLIDPSLATMSVLETIAKLSLEVAQTNVQLLQLSKSSPNSPQIGSLRIRQAALEAQIAIERHRLAGDAQSIAPRIALYERLMLERDFAERALVSAMAALEVSRTEAIRQQVYLERISTPSRPDYPAYPWKMTWSIVTLVIGLLVWRLWRLVAVDAQKHVEP